MGEEPFLPLYSLEVHFAPGSFWVSSVFTKWQEPRMKSDFNVIIERDSEGHYVGSVPDLRGCHTQARSLDTLMDRMKEAIELCLEVEGEEAEALDFVGVQKITVAR
jgi:predicted RNase H-like HicB family nuclease